VALSSGPGRSAFFIPGDAEGSMFSADSSNNASNDNTAPGFAIAVDDSEFVSLTPGSIDLHLANTQSSTMATGGTPLDTSFDHDIDGEARSIPWSIGADQNPTAAPQ
jgi:hypothetical protein